jgi:hypothetical protein
MSPGGQTLPKTEAGAMPAFPPIAAIIHASITGDNGATSALPRSPCLPARAFVAFELNATTQLSCDAPLDHKELLTPLGVDGHFPRVTPMRAKKPSAFRIASVLIELASHTVMGVAVGLAFALILLAADQGDVASLIDHGAASETTRLEYVGVVVLAFAFGATLTGLVFMFTEES